MNEIYEWWMRWGGDGWMGRWMALLEEMRKKEGREKERIGKEKLCKVYYMVWYY